MTESTPKPAPAVAPAPAPAPSPRVPKGPMLTLSSSWKDAALWAYAAIALAIFAWEITHRDVLEVFALNVDDPGIGRSQKTERSDLLLYVAFALPVAAAGALNVFYRAYCGRSRWPTFFLPLVIALVTTPFFTLRMFEYRRPFMTGLMVLALAAALAHFATGLCKSLGWRFRELTRRQAWIVVGAGFALFTVWIGFMAHWRFITFQAMPYDMSWETNAAHNVLHTGVPKTSVGSSAYYPTGPLPADYSPLHVPGVYYLYAPIYALYQDGRTLLWLQAAGMGAGALGIYLIARSWLRSNSLAALLGVAYVFFPHVQISCMHDLHANQMAVPLLFGALAAVEQKRLRWAAAFVFFLSFCREETGVYGIAAGLYWALFSRNRKTNLFGWGTVVFSLAVLLFITQYVMVRSGGTPRYGHFTFYFDKVGITSILKSYVLNPIGAVQLLLNPTRLEYMWLSLLPFGLLPLLGWRAVVFLLIPMGLLFPAITPTFFVAGINYSAPIMATVVLFAIMGVRRYVGPRNAPDANSRRIAITVFVGTTALLSSVLYGNIFGKTYKWQFGSLPYRYASQFDYMGQVGMVESLPPYGDRERLLWDLVRRVPDGPILTSARINPQLANRSISLVYPDFGEGHPPETHPRYVVLDRMPPVKQAPEDWEREMRADKRFEIYYENAMGIIFRRK